MSPLPKARACDAKGCGFAAVGRFKLSDNCNPSLCEGHAHGGWAGEFPTTKPKKPKPRQTKANRYPTVIPMLQKTWTCGSGWVAEHKFHPQRRWRFDFALPLERLAVEIDGGTFSGGRHTRGKGHLADCEKLNAATVMGWRVLRFIPAQIKDGTMALTVLKAAKGTVTITETTVVGEAGEK